MDRYQHYWMKRLSIILTQNLVNDSLPDEYIKPSKTLHSSFDYLRASGQSETPKGTSWTISRLYCRFLFGNVSRDNSRLCT